MKYIKILTMVLLSTVYFTGVTNAVPVEEWNKIFEPKMFECGIDYCELYASVVEQISGEYVLAGEGFVGNDEGSHDYGWIIKTDSYGNIRWKKDQDCSIDDLQHTSDGGFIGTGTTGGWYYEVQNYVACIIKTDSLGNKQWYKKFGNSSDDEIDIFRSINQTKDGGYILTGDISGNSLLLKTDSLGNRQWSKAIEGNSVQQTKDGGFVIVGKSLIKTDSLGNKQWSKTFGPEEYANSIQQTKDGGFVIAGYGYGPNNIAWLMKTDSLGNKFWNNTFGRVGYSYGANSVQQTKDGGFIVAGHIGNPNSSSTYSSAWLLKLSPEKAIVITSPNGGENWKRGTSNTIAWKNTGGTGQYVKIDLLKGGLLNKTIVSTTLNDGSYSWTIPSIQTIGNDYKIRITSTSNSAYRDTSNNNFIISSANLLKNPGFETSDGIEPMYWDKYQTGIKALFTYPEIGRTGTGKSISIKYTTKDIGKVALWQQSGIVIVPSKQYKLSGYMKLSNVTGGGTYPRYNGADLRVNWYKSDGGLIKVDLITKSGTSAWTRYEKTFTSPSNAIKATVGGDLFNTSGKVWFDDIEFIRI